MKITISTQLKQMDGIKPMPNLEKNGIPLTLKDVCMSALLIPTAKDDGKQKDADYKLFKEKLRDAGKEVELTAEEVARIKEKIGLTQPPLILGQAWEMLEKNQ